MVEVAFSADVTEFAMVKFCTVCATLLTGAELLAPMKFASFSYVAVIVWLPAVAGNCTEQTAVPVPVTVPLLTPTVGHGVLGIQTPVEEANLKLPLGKTGPV